MLRASWLFVVCDGRGMYAGWVLGGLVCIMVEGRHEMIDIHTHIDIHTINSSGGKAGESGMVRYLGTLLGDE